MIRVLSTLAALVALAVSAQPASAAASNQTHTGQPSIKRSLTAPLGSTKGSFFSGDAYINEMG